MHTENTCSLYFIWTEPDKFVTGQTLEYMLYTIYTLEYKLVARHTNLGNFQLNLNLHVLDLTFHS